MNRRLKVFRQGLDEEECKKYFAIGRHENIDSMLYCYSYKKLPLSIINYANTLFISPQDEVTMAKVYYDLLRDSMSYNEFKDYCFFCWRDNSLVNYDIRKNDKNKNILYLL